MDVLSGGEYLHFDVAPPTSTSYSGNLSNFSKIFTKFPSELLDEAILESLPNFRLFNMTQCAWLSNDENMPSSDAYKMVYSL